MIELVWRCPYCGSRHRSTVRSINRLSKRSQIRSRLVSHFSADHLTVGPFERSQMADLMVAELLA